METKHLKLQNEQDVQLKLVKSHNSQKENMLKEELLQKLKNH